MKRLAPVPTPVTGLTGLPCAAAAAQTSALSAAVNSGSLQGMNEFWKKSPLGAICACEVLRVTMTSPYAFTCGFTS